MFGNTPPEPEEINGSGKIACSVVYKNSNRIMNPDHEIKITKTGVYFKVSGRWVLEPGVYSVNYAASPAIEDTAA